MFHFYSCTDFLSDSIYVIVQTQPLPCTDPFIIHLFFLLPNTIMSLFLFFIRIEIRSRMMVIIWSLYDACEYEWCLYRSRIKSMCGLILKTYLYSYLSFFFFLPNIQLISFITIHVSSFLSMNSNIT